MIEMVYNNIGSVTCVHVVETWESPESWSFKLPQQMKCVQAFLAEGGREGAGEQYM